MHAGEPAFDWFLISALGQWQRALIRLFWRGGSVRTQQLSGRNLSWLVQWLQLLTFFFFFSFKGLKKKVYPALECVTYEWMSPAFTSCKWTIIFSYNKPILGDRWCKRLFKETSAVEKKTTSSQAPISEERLQPSSPSTTKEGMKRALWFSSIVQCSAACVFWQLSIFTFDTFLIDVE